MAFGPIASLADEETMETVRDSIFLGSRIMAATTKLKGTCSWEEKL